MSLPTETATSSVEWNSKTDRYYKAWSEQLKCREFGHLEAHQFYRRINVANGIVGSLAGVTTFMTSVTSLFTEGSSGPCEAGTSCFALKITNLVLLAVVNVAVNIFLFYKPAALAEQHKTAADKFNELSLRIDWCLRRSKGLREQFWHFTERIITDFTQLNKEAPSIPTRSNSSLLNRNADTITLSIGSITSLASQAPQQHNRRRHTVTGGSQRQHVIVQQAAAAATMSAPAIVFHHPEEPPPVYEDEEDEAAAAAIVADADAAVEKIERDNARRFEKIRRKSISTRNIEEGLAEKRRELVSDPKPLRWLKKQMGLVEEDD